MARKSRYLRYEGAIRTMRSAGNAQESPACRSGHPGSVLEKLKALKGQGQIPTAEKGGTHG